MAEYKMEGVVVTTDVSADYQECSYMNGTLQSVGEGLAITVHTYIDVPSDIASQGQGAVTDYVLARLVEARVAVPALTFEVEVGSSVDE